MKGMRVSRRTEAGVGPALGCGVEHFRREVAGTTARNSNGREQTGEANRPEGSALGDLVDQTVTDLTAGTRHQDDRSAHHTAIIARALGPHRRLASFNLDEVMEKRTSRQ